MTTDRFLTLAKPPTQDQLQMALEGYLNGAATVTLNEGRWICHFPSKASEPYKELAPEFYFVRADGDRWFEVEMDGEDFNVRTKQQDEFVSAVAAGFLAFAKRFWQGKELPNRR